LMTRHVEGRAARILVTAASSVHAYMEGLL
jgi:hypothetical protein